MQFLVSDIHVVSRISSGAGSRRATSCGWRGWRGSSTGCVWRPSGRAATRRTPSSTPCGDPVASSTSTGTGDFIGRNIKESAIQKLLDSCILTDEEMALGPTKWKETMETEDSITLDFDGGAKNGDYDDEEEEEDDDEDDEESEDDQISENGKRKINLVEEEKSKKKKSG